MSMMYTATNAVNLAMSSDVLKTMVLGTGILTLKMFLTNLYSAIPSIYAGTHAPEDSWFWQRLGAPKQTHGAAYKDKAAQHTAAYQAMLRAKRVVMNDLENIPTAIIIFWMAALVNSSAAQDVANLFVFFVAARCLYSVVYYAGITGARTACYMAGAASMLRALFLGLQGVGLF